MTPSLPVLLALIACSGAPTDTGAPPEDTAPVLDADGDGFSAAEGDCDDADAARFPGAQEVCNAVDDDCDGTTDEELDRDWYPDEDDDGYGDDASASVRACAAPDGMVADRSDCNDADPDRHPDAPEPDCTDPVDYDCDGVVAYADADGDGFAACEDCDDADPAVRPDAAEVCNGRDDDCDGAADGSDAAGQRTWYADLDGDGAGDPSASTSACAAPPNHVADASDCDDADPTSFPGAPEPDCADPVDHDCDGFVVWADADADGAAACEDCDDADAAVSPLVPETCDGLDDDCDGTVDEADAIDAIAWYPDTDGDGRGDGVIAAWRACEPPPGHVEDATDCDDGDASVSPDAFEACDGVDDDCDGAVDEPDATDAYLDADGDGYGDPVTVTRTCPASGRVADATDCDDGDAAVSPGASETCDGVDDDCDGDTDEDGAIDADTWHPDADADGYGARDTSRAACTAPVGWVSDGSDRDDTDASVYPGSTVLAFSGELAASGVSAAELTWTSGGWRAGYGLETVDDIDGDGIADLVVGVRGTPSDPSGSVFVHSGATAADVSLDAGRLWLQADEDHPWPVWLAALGGGWVAAATVGDSTSRPGAVFVFDASATSSGALADVPLAIEAASEDAFSDAALAPWGAADASGRRGLAIAAPGEAAIGVWDSGSLAAGSWSDAPIRVSLSGYMGSTAQVHAAAVGDTDGDGVDELAVGLPQRLSSGSDDGWVFLLPGDLAAGSYAVADVATGLTDSGGRAGLGHVVRAAGDLDGDGLADVIASTTAETFVLSGARIPDGLSDATLLTVTGRAWNVIAGLDLDGDGADDLVNGLAYANGGGVYQSGEVEIHLGPLTDGGSRDSSTAAAVLTGSTSGDGLGWALAAIPDPDGDGCDRLAVAGFYNGSTDAPVLLVDGCK